MDVLIVEDDHLERKALVRLFELCYPGRFQMSLSGDAASALTQLGRRSFDLVMLDINLPDQSGLEVLKQIHASWPDTKVIMASAYSDYQHLRASMRDHAVDYLVKPYSMDTFREAVDDFFKEKAENPEVYGTKKTCQQVLQYLYAHYDQPVTLDALASLVHYDKSYLGRLFKKTYGVSIFSYLDQIRLDKAKEFLKEGMPVAETAGRTGFQDPSHFGKWFKNQLGVSPQQYVSRLSKLS